MHSAGKLEGGEALELSGPIRAYFALHGLLASVVISLEIAVLVTGLVQWKGKGSKPIAWHRRLAWPLFFLWWFAFLSGELFYLVVYVI